MPHSTGFEDECPPLQVVEEVVVVCRAGDDTYEEHVEVPFLMITPVSQLRTPFCPLLPSVCTLLRHPKMVIKALTAQ